MKKPCRKVVDRNEGEPVRSTRKFAEREAACGRFFRDVRYPDGGYKGTNVRGGGGTLVDVVKELILASHPVGSIEVNTTGANPSTYLGGTWVAWGSGQDRVNRLRAAGYDPTAVQKAVNRMYG